MKPCADYVHLRLDPMPERSGAIVMPFTNPSGFRKATVLATGPGLWHRKKEARIAMETRKGDRVAVSEVFVFHMREKWGDLMPKDELLVSEDEILWKEIDDV